MVSLISHTAAGESVEVGIVGFEGVAGVSAILGVDKSPHEALVQIPGGGARLPVRALRDEFKRGGALHDRLLRYTQGLLLQTSQVAACNRLHTLSERLARWLMMSYDRCACDDLPFTQEFLSLMLGVRRAEADGGRHHPPDRRLHNLPPGPHQNHRQERARPSLLRLLRRHQRRVRPPDGVRLLTA